MAKERFRETADYTVSAGPDGYCFRFYCAVSGALPCVAGPIRKGSQDTTLETAWQTVGQSHFNQCHRCGRWVPDVMYNADALECVECALWKLPLYFCPECGVGHSCARCGVRLPGAKEPREYYQRIRRIGMEQYGFGPDAMKKKEGLPGLRRRYGGSLQFLPPVQQAAAEPVIPTKKARTGGFL